MLRKYRTFTTPFKLKFWLPQQVFFRYLLNEFNLLNGTRRLLPSMIEYERLFTRSFYVYFFLL